MRRRTVQLTQSEQQWLNAYRQALGAQYAGTVEEMLIYGSKARGDAGPESDLDVLLIVKDRAVRQKRALRRVGYLLAAATDVVPSIMAYTRGEWEQRKQSGSPFRRAVDRDGVRVL
ncbi:MAG TPA: nucleotidyltransferase domain-containing protein [Gemmataceae bacterium]|jgi:predicted nucleotidyltransferase|nr:nucleotidyltransferase domain-containing protein [Gemmataceae bacterium]